MKENLENTSLDKCLVLKKAFQKKENFLVCELETSAEKISCLQGTVCVMDKVCVTKGNRNLKKLLNKKLQTTKIEKKKLIKLSKKERKLSKFNTKNIKRRLKRDKESNKNVRKEKSNENTTKGKKHLETQLLEVQGNPDQFQKCKKQNDNLTKKSFCKT